MLRQRPGRVVSGCTVQRNRRTAEPQTERMTLRAEMESGRQVREPQTVQHGFTLWWLGEDETGIFSWGQNVGGLTRHARAQSSPRHYSRCWRHGSRHVTWPGRCLQKDSLATVWKRSKVWRDFRKRAQLKFIFRLGERRSYQQQG